MKQQTQNITELSDQSNKSQSDSESKDSDVLGCESNQVQLCQVEKEVSGNNQQAVSLIKSLDEYYQTMRGRKAQESYYNYMQQYARKNFEEKKINVMPSCYEELDYIVKKYYDEGKIGEQPSLESLGLLANVDFNQSSNMKRMSTLFVKNEGFNNKINQFKKIQDEIENTQVSFQLKPIYIDDVQQILVLTWEQYKIPREQTNNLIEEEYPVYKYTKSLRIFDLRFNLVKTIVCEKIYSLIELQKMCEVSVMQADHMIYFFKREYHKGKNTDLTQVPLRKLKSTLRLYKYHIKQQMSEDSVNEETRVTNNDRGYFIEEKDNQKLNPTFIMQLDLDGTDIVSDNYQIRNMGIFKDKFILLECYKLGLEDVHNSYRIYMMTNSKVEQINSSTITDNVEQDDDESQDLKMSIELKKHRSKKKEFVANNTLEKGETLLSLVYSQEQSNRASKMDRMINNNIVQFSCMKKESDDLYVFILICEFTQFHLKIKLGDEMEESTFEKSKSFKRDSREPDQKGEPIYQHEYSTYQFLKMYDPNVTIHRADLIETGEKGELNLLTQYYLLNSRSQIQLIYPFFTDNEKKYKQIDIIKEKYKIEYLLEIEIFIKVLHQDCSLTNKIKEYMPQYNKIRDKHDLFTQLNLRKDQIEIFQKKGTVIQMVCDGINQQILYIHNCFEPSFIAFFLKDTITEELFKRPCQVKQDEIIQFTNEQIQKLASIPSSEQNHERREFIRNFFQQLIFKKKDMKQNLSNLLTESRYKQHEPSANFETIQNLLKLNSELCQCNNGLYNDCEKHLDHISKTIQIMQLKSENQPSQTVYKFKDSELNKHVCFLTAPQKANFDKICKKYKSDKNISFESLFKEIEGSKDKLTLHTKERMFAAYSSHYKESHTHQLYGDISVKSKIQVQLNLFREAWEEYKLHSILYSLTIIDKELVEQVSRKIKKEFEIQNQDLQINFQIEHMQLCVQKNESAYMFVVSVVSILKNFRHMSYLFLKVSQNELFNMIANFDTANQDQLHFHFNSENLKKQLKTQLFQNADEKFNIMLKDGKLLKATLHEVLTFHLQNHSNFAANSKMMRKSERLCEYHNIKLHFENLDIPHQEGINHLVFIYDQCMVNFKEGKNTWLMCYDILKEEIVLKHQFNFKGDQLRYYYMDKLDFMMFKIVRTSDVFECLVKKDEKVVNYQVFSFFIQKMGLIEIKEFQFRTTRKKTQKVSLFGQKYLYLSEGMMEQMNYDEFIQFKVFRYINQNNDISGSSIWFKNQREIQSLDEHELKMKTHKTINLVEESEVPIVYQVAKHRLDKDGIQNFMKMIRKNQKYIKYPVIALNQKRLPPDYNYTLEMVKIDENTNKQEYFNVSKKLRTYTVSYLSPNSRLYMFESNLVKAGIKKYQIEHQCYGEKPMYVSVVSVRLRMTDVANEVFNIPESLHILNTMTQLINKMRIPTLEFLILKGFESEKEQNFFVQQTCLQGLSICDLAIDDHNVIKQALYDFDLDGINTNEKENMIEQLLNKNSERKQTFIEMEMIPNQQQNSYSTIVSFDFNMDSTIYRGIKFNASRSVQLLLDMIFNDKRYNSLSNYLMFDLPELLSYYPGITLHRFFEMPTRLKSLEWDQYCSVRHLLWSQKSKTRFYSSREQQIIVVDKEIIDKEIDRTRFFKKLVENRDQQNPDNNVTWAVDIQVSQQPESDEVPKALISSPINSDTYSDDAFKQINQEKEEEEEQQNIKKQEDENFFQTESWCIDFEYMFLGQKIKQLSSKNKTKLKFNHLYYSELILRNSENKLFLEQDTVQRFIKFQFQYSKNFFWFMCLIYVFFFFLPLSFSIYTTQRLSTESNYKKADGIKDVNEIRQLKQVDWDTKVFYYNVCHYEQVFNLAYILLKVLVLAHNRQLGQKVEWVVFNLFHFVVFYSLYFIDQQVDENFEPTLLKIEYIKPIKVLMMIMCIKKLYELITVWDYLSYFIYLFFNTIWLIRMKMFMFLVFQIFFALLFISLETTPDPEFTESGINYPMQIFTFCWFNSLAKLKKPYILVEKMEGNIHQMIHVSLIYFTYVFHILFMFAIMVNLMVAIINSAYSVIDQHRLFYLYKFKAQLNYDYFLMFKYIITLKEFNSEFSSLVFTTEIKMNMEDSMQAEQVNEDEELIKELTKLIDDYYDKQRLIKEEDLKIIIKEQKSLQANLKMLEQAKKLAELKRNED